MHIAQQDLNLEHLWVVCPGVHTYPIEEKITVVSIQNLARLKE